MVAGQTGWRSSGWILLFALACFAMGFVIAFVVQWAMADDGEARNAQSKATILAFEKRVRDLESELRGEPVRRVQTRPSSNLGEPVKVQTMRIGPDGLPKADR
jgi:hypothetical protein